MSECSCPLCGAEIVDSGAILIDFEGGLVVANGRLAQLTKQELAIFEAIWAARPRTVSRDALLHELYSLRPDADEPEIKIIDVFVCKLRAKFKPLGVLIETVWGTGYRITQNRSIAK